MEIERLSSDGLQKAYELFKTEHAVDDTYMEWIGLSLTKGNGFGQAANKIVDQLSGQDAGNRSENLVTTVVKLMDTLITEKEEEALSRLEPKLYQEHAVEYQNRRVSSQLFYDALEEAQMTFNKLLSYVGRPVELAVEGAPEIQQNVLWTYGDSEKVDRNKFENALRRYLEAKSQEMFVGAEYGMTQAAFSLIELTTTIDVIINSNSDELYTEYLIIQEDVIAEDFFDDAMDVEEEFSTHGKWEDWTEIWINELSLDKDNSAMYNRIPNNWFTTMLNKEPLQSNLHKYVGNVEGLIETYLPEWEQYVETDV